MFSHSNTASFFSVLMAAVIYWLSLAGVAWAQGNTSFGTGALQNNTTGNFNTAIGLNALFGNNTGTQNTATGVNALLSNTIGDLNTGVGVNALISNIDGTQNTANGHSALFSNSTGDFNTASGVNALSSNTTGSQNTASGVQALFSNTTGGKNSANGVNALFSNTIGTQNTATGVQALFSNTGGNFNNAFGNNALFENTTGGGNTAIGDLALTTNTIGANNTGVGNRADVSVGNLVNATAIGSFATVNANNKIRLGNTLVTVIEGQVAFTAVSDKTQKENFQSVDGEEVLGKIRGFELSSWNFIGHDPKEFRHYGPMAQDFYAAFGHDEVGQIGSETTINSGDMAGILMIAVQALEKRTAELRQKEAQIAGLVVRLEALELRQNQSIQLSAERSLDGKMVDVMP